MPTAIPRETSSRSARLSTRRDRRRGAGRIPPCGLRCAKIAPDDRSNTRPISFSPSPRCQRSQTSALSTALNIRRRLFAIASPHPSLVKCCDDLLRPPPKADSGSIRHRPHCGRSAPSRNTNLPLERRPMTNFALPLPADRGQAARPIHLVDKTSFGGWLKGRPAEDRALIEAHRFDGKTGFAFVMLPRGGEFEVVSTVKDATQLSPWCLAKLAEGLPEGPYKLAEGEPGRAALGWLLAQHRFDAYRSKKDEPERGPRVLLTGEAARIEGVVGLAGATALVRDLVNIPAGDLGPADLEAAARDEAKRAGAKLRVTAGDELRTGYPLIDAVGRAAIAERAPRLIELEWGDPQHPRVAIGGKCVCFDSGGLRFKHPSGHPVIQEGNSRASHSVGR